MRSLLLLLATSELCTLGAALQLVRPYQLHRHAPQQPPSASRVCMQLKESEDDAGGDADGDESGAPSGFGGFGQYVSETPEFDEPEWNDWDEADAADPRREGAIDPKEVLLRRRSTLRRWAEFVQNIGVDGAEGDAGEDGAAQLVEMLNVSLSFGERRVLRPQTWAVREGQRVGVLGESGCGKSLQLQLLAGRREPTTGVVRRHEGVTIELVSQDVAAELRAHGGSLKEFLREAVGEGREREQRSEATASTDAEATLADAEASLLAQLPAALRTAAALGSPLSELSSGQLVRVGIAAAVARAPPLLLLDEPTNHLDLEGIEWLEAALGRRKEAAAIVIVSHDRQVLERVSSHMLDSAGGDGRLYGGSYSQFVQSAATRAEMRQQIESAETRLSADEVDGAGGTAAGMAEQAVAASRLAPSRFRIEGPSGTKSKKERAAAPMLELDAARVTFGGERRGAVSLFSNVSFRVYRGEVVLLLGENGAGKSSLLKACLGELPLDEGNATFSPVARHFYFAQEAAQAMVAEMPAATPAEWLAAAAPQAGEEARLRTLKRMGFPRETHTKSLSALSGGEKSRLVLCQLLLSRANLLLLDEPTNHLDLTAREYLQEAVRYFDGAVVLVSHDRYFAARTATRIAELREGELHHCAGGYAKYLEGRRELRERLSSREVEGMAPLLELEDQSPRQKRRQRQQKRAR